MSIANLRERIRVIVYDEKTKPAPMGGPNTYLVDVSWQHSLYCADVLGVVMACPRRDTSDGSKIVPWVEVQKDPTAADYIRLTINDKSIIEPRDWVKYPYVEA